jgi:hypothetical protein
MNLYIGAPVTFQNTGGALPGNLVANAVYYAWPSSTTTFCVATTFENAVSGNFVAYSSAGTGTTTAYASTTGAQIGESDHTMLVPEIATTTANFNISNQSAGSTGVYVGANGATGGGVISSTPFGASLPFNVTQPSTLYNIFIKL